MSKSWDTLGVTHRGDRCNFAFRLMNYIPPAIVTGIIGIPYYTYTFINCKILLEDEVQPLVLTHPNYAHISQAPGPFFGYVCLSVIHIFMFLLLWSFAQSIMVDPGRVPE